MKHSPFTVAGLLSLCLTVSAVFAGDPPPSADGIYRLTLYGAPGLERTVADRAQIAVTVWLERRGGNFTQGFAVAETFAPDAQEVDFRGLKLEGDRLSGDVKVSWRPFHVRHGIGAKADVPPVIRTYPVDLVLKEHEVATKFNEDAMMKGRLAMVSAIRFDAPVMPERTAWEFAIQGCLDRSLLKGGRGGDDPYADTDVEIRLALPAKEASVHGNTRSTGGDAAFVNPLLAHRPATVTEWQLAGDRLRAGVKFLTKEGGTEYVVTLEGRRLGWLVSGTATIAYSGQTRTAPFLGWVWTSPVSNLPVIPKGPPPAAPAAAKADPALVAAAVAQANQPLFVAEPGGREFWYWRWVISGSLSCIHPPFFEVKEMPGAVKYRIALKHRDGKEYAFEADKPWRPLTPIWKDLPYDTYTGGYRLSVTGLDADGKPLATPAEFHKWTRRTPEELPEAEKVKIDHGWFSHGRKVKGEYKAKSVWYVPDKPITIAKRRPFDGPYVAPVPPAEARARILQAARWMRDGIGTAEYRGLLRSWESVGGSVESLFRGGGRAIGNALALQLADDPAERQGTRLLLDAVGNLLIGDQECNAGLNRLYANHTCMHIWDGGAFLDMFAATGADKYRQSALRTARECVYYQLPDGAFGGAGPETLGNGARKGGAVPPAWMGGHWWPDGMSTEIRSFNPAAFLWFLGRLRRDLKTNDFLENEQRAMKYVRWNLANDFFWVEDGPHTPPLDYPAPNHSHIVQYLLLYLLQYAAPEDRDLKLIEQLALWCEDRNVIWDRVWDRYKGPTSGGSKDGGRSGGAPAEILARMAHIYGRLWQATKNPLHRAKAESLLSVVLAAQDPRTGDIPMHLVRAGDGAPRLKPDQPAVRFGIMLRDLLGAADALDQKQPK